MLGQLTTDQGDHGTNPLVGEHKIENMMAHEPRRTHKKKLHLTDHSPSHSLEPYLVA